MGSSLHEELKRKMRADRKGYGEWGQNALLSRIRRSVAGTEPPVTCSNHTQTNIGQRFSTFSVEYLDINRCYEGIKSVIK